jgi:hypothetical protein
MSYASIIKPKSSSSSPSSKPSEVRSLVHSSQGQVLRVVLRSGSIYEGVLAPLQHDGLTLLYARRVDSATPLTEPYEPSLHVPLNTLVQLRVQFESPCSVAKREEHKFKTDTEISQGEGAGQRRTLQRFAFASEEGKDKDKEMVSLEEEISRQKSGTQWDQYAVCFVI